MHFDLTPEDRNELWSTLVTAAEKYYAGTDSNPVAPKLNQQTIKSFITDFAGKKSTLKDSLNHVLKGMTDYAVHTPHPAYFGLFNPRTSFPGILADTLTAIFNPQLAAWSHAPFAAEVEDYIINYFGSKFGLPQTDGVFTSGGAEANLNAILCALNNAFPAYAELGLQQLKEKPVVYCSAESHHSIIKSLRVAGLGSDAVRTIAVDKDLKMDVLALSAQIEADKRDGYHPLMIIATAGTTGAGAIDPIQAISAIANAGNIWLHVDAAYGGALILSSHAGLLAGIEKANSITFDAHKWLSVPMGTSLFLTSHTKILSQTFRITTDYMPQEKADTEVTDPYVHSIQWSRRFNGLKIYLPLIMLGEETFKETIDGQMETGNLLRNKLIEAGWEIYNKSLLPVICFGRKEFHENGLAGKIAQHIISKGNAWLSVYPIQGTSLLRACVTNYNSGEKEIDILINELDVAFKEMCQTDI